MEGKARNGNFLEKVATVLILVHQNQNSCYFFQEISNDSSNKLIVLLLLYMYGMSLIGISFIVSTFFTNARYAS